MQIDAKAGGHLWKINLPVKNVMFVGIDTYHDSLSGDVQLADLLLV